MKADTSNNYAYNKKLQHFANALRNRMTKSEACLWKYALKARKMKGYQFRRQRPVLNYIADFMCKELKLIIELDGITHQYEETAVKDEKRTKDLESSGFVIIRFTDNEVLNNIEGVIWRIEKVIEDLERSTPLIPRQRGTQRSASRKNEERGYNPLPTGAKREKSEKNSETE